MFREDYACSFWNTHTPSLKNSKSFRKGHRHFEVGCHGTSWKCLEVTNGRAVGFA